MSYQWNLPEMITQASQWVKVPDDRHGGSEIGGLILCERPLAITQASRQREIDKALGQSQALLNRGIPGGATLEGRIRIRQGDELTKISSSRGSPELSFDDGRPKFSISTKIA